MLSSWSRAMRGGLMGLNGGISGRFDQPLYRHAQAAAKIDAGGQMTGVSLLRRLALAAMVVLSSFVGLGLAGAEDADLLINTLRWLIRPLSSPRFLARLIMQNWVPGFPIDNLTSWSGFTAGSFNC